MTISIGVMPGVPEDACALFGDDDTVLMDALLRSAVAHASDPDALCPEFVGPLEQFTQRRALPGGDVALTSPNGECLTIHVADFGTTVIVGVRRRHALARDGIVESWRDRLPHEQRVGWVLQAGGGEAAVLVWTSEPGIWRACVTIDDGETVAVDVWSPRHALALAVGWLGLDHETVTERRGPGFDLLPVAFAAGLPRRTDLLGEIVCGDTFAAWLAPGPRLTPWLAVVDGELGTPRTPRLHVADLIPALPLVDTVRAARLGAGPDAAVPPLAHFDALHPDALRAQLRCEADPDGGVVRVRMAEREVVFEPAGGGRYGGSVTGGGSSIGLSGVDPHRLYLILVLQWTHARWRPAAEDADVLDTLSRDLATGRAGRVDAVRRLGSLLNAGEWPADSDVPSGPALHAIVEREVLRSLADARRASAAHVPPSTEDRDDTQPRLGFLEVGPVRDGRVEGRFHHVGAGGHLDVASVSWWLAEAVCVDSVVRELERPDLDDAAAIRLHDYLDLAAGAGRESLVAAYRRLDEIHHSGRCS